jgi:hypothetical protein
MGTPRIYYYPDDTGTLETVNLGETLSDLTDDQEVIGGQSTGDGGVLQRTVDGSFWRVRVLLSRFGTTPGSSELERQLQSFTNHAQRGGPFIFSRDHDKTYAVKLASAPARAATALTATSNNGLFNINSSAGVTTGDELVIESAGREDRREIKTGGASTTAITLGSGLDYTFTQTTFVRWRDCYPVCFLEEASPIVRSDRRRNWSLDLTFTYSASAAVRLFRAANEDAMFGYLKLSTVSSTASKFSLQAMLVR